MKPEKAGIKGQGFEVWCDYCCIRIAPHEEIAEGIPSEVYDEYPI